MEYPPVYFGENKFVGTRQMQGKIIRHHSTDRSLTGSNLPGIIGHDEQPTMKGASENGKVRSL